MIETPLPLDLKALLTSAANGYGEAIDAAGAVDAVFEYIADRLPGYYGDRGLSGDVVDAVLATGSTVPADIDRRILAVGQFRKLDAADALAAANKRIRNILKKAPSEAGANAIVSAALIDPAEQRLAQRIESMQSVIEPLLAAKDYAGVLRTLAELRTDVDGFFDAVMVMADDPQLRANRIAILRGVATLFLTVADISRLQSTAAAS
jgi:glycyl-tRNA synthetase beta chain